MDGIITFSFGMLETIIGFGGVFWLDSQFCCMDGQNMKNKSKINLKLEEMNK